MSHFFSNFATRKGDILTLKSRGQGHLNTKLMTKKRALEMERILKWMQSERNSKLFNVTIVERGFKDDPYEVHVSCANTAYRHEMNAIVMAMDGCGMCVTYMQYNELEGEYWNLQ